MHSAVNSSRPENSRARGGKSHMDYGCLRGSRARHQSLGFVSSLRFSALWVPFKRQSLVHVFWVQLAVRSEILADERQKRWHRSPPPPRPPRREMRGNDGRGLSSP